MDGGGLRLNMNALDYVLLALYFVTVLGVGFAARRAIRTSVDFFLSGRSLPAWVTGLAFVSANLGALEIIGMAANGAQYGVMTVHYYWIGAVPAMVFLGIVMMPFYYGSKVRSVPEYLRLRFNRPTHLLNAITFAVAQVLIAGVNLYALALVMQALLGWPLWVAIVVGAAIVLVYITIGGLSGAIYNEVLQFFVILAGLIPVTVIGLVKVGGVSGLIALVTVKGLGAPSGDLQYNNAIPLLMRDLLPNGVLGVAVTGLIASFMAGMAANVSGFNTVFTYDIWQAYVRRDRPDDYYLRIGRYATIAAVVIGIGTAFIAAGFSNIMNYIQALFSVFNAPLFGTFIIGMFWKRMSALAGFWSLLSGTVVAVGTYLLYKGGVIHFNSDLEESFWGAGLAFATVAVVAAILTPLTAPERDEDLRGLVYGMGGVDVKGDVLAGDAAWYRSPVLLGVIALVLAVVLYIPVF
ncbi:Na+/galactose cotransporter [Micromonospora costi]|uniref:sodium:solute symporter family transporter n=1 Tax=Micromonospora costi TaxID=1530042 RepID=UPI0033EA28AC